jgi:hypothetical protein
MTINILSDAELDAVSGGARVGNHFRNGGQVNAAGVIFLGNQGSLANSNTANSNANNTGNNNSFVNNNTINAQ